MKHHAKTSILLATVSLAFLAMGFALAKPEPQAVVIFPEVIMPQAPQSYDYLYLAGVWEGNIAIFEPGNSTQPKFISEIPLATLTNHDAQLFTQGKKLYSNEELAQLLEDFGS